MDMRLLRILDADVEFLHRYAFSSVLGVLPIFKQFYSVPPLIFKAELEPTVAH